MLSHEDNELMTRVGPGTAMGDYLRRFWLPFGSGFGVARDRIVRPARFTLLGEKLIAFRDSGEARARRGELPASRRVAVFRSQ